MLCSHYHIICYRDNLGCYVLLLQNQKLFKIGKQCKMFFFFHRYITEKIKILVPIRKINWDFQPWKHQHSYYLLSVNYRMDDKQSWYQCGASFWVAILWILRWVRFFGRLLFWVLELCDILAGGLHAVVSSKPPQYRTPNSHIHHNPHPMYWEYQELQVS